MKQDLIINKLYEMRARPAMYLGIVCISRLHMYINGYMTRQGEIDSASTTRFESFGSFVNDYYDAHSYAAGWECIIKRYEGDGERSVAKFYELLDLFVESQESGDPADGPSE